MAIRLVLNAFGSNEHLPDRNVDRAIAKIDPQIAFDYQERLVGIFVVMPYKIALQLHHFELIIIHFGNDLRLPLKQLSNTISQTGIGCSGLTNGFFETDFPA